MSDPIRAALERIIDAHDADESVSIRQWTTNLTIAIKEARATLLLADNNGGPTTPKPAPPVRRVPRKAVQLAVTNHNTIFVVADDGSTWVLPPEESEWVELPSLSDRVEEQP